MTVLLLVLVAVLVWVALFGLRRIPALLSLPAGVQMRIRSVLPAVSLTAWLLFGIWAVNTLTAVDEYTAIVIAVVLSMFALLFGWFVLRDLVAGIVFTARHPSLPGLHIEAGGYAGRVLRTGILGLDIRAEGGETVHLPYSTLAAGAVAEHPPERSVDEFRLRVSIPGDSNGDEAAEQVRGRLLLSPWVNAVRPPTVHVRGSGRERVAEIIYHCLNKEHALHVEESLRQIYDVRHPEDGSSIGAE